MRKLLPHLLLCLSAVCFATAWWLQCRQRVRYVEIAPPVGMKQAGIYLSNEVPNPEGILVLADGVNSVGGALIRQEEWRAFARKHRLVLAEVAFASATGFHNPDSSCYYYAKNGSGDALLKLLDERFPTRPPLLLFGFSGGGHFASRFQEWRPDRVKAWAVTGVNWWDEAATENPEDFPPGLVLTGDQEGNFARTVRAFQERNALGRKVLWCGLKDFEHTMPYHALSLVRAFFAACLDERTHQWQRLEFEGTDAGQSPSPFVTAEWEKIPKVPAVEPDLTEPDNSGQQ